MEFVRFVLFSPLLEHCYIHAYVPTSEHTSWFRHTGVLTSRFILPLISWLLSLRVRGRCQWIAANVLRLTVHLFFDRKTSLCRFPCERDIRRFSRPSTSSWRNKAADVAWPPSSASRNVLLTALNSAPRSSRTLTRESPKTPLTTTITTIVRTTYTPVARRRHTAENGCYRVRIFTRPRRDRDRGIRGTAVVYGRPPRCAPCAVFPASPSPKTARALTSPLSNEPLVHAYDPCADCRTAGCPKTYRV